MDELVVADVEAHMRDAFLVGVGKEHEVADLRLVDIIAAVVVAGSGIAADFLAGLVGYIVDEAAAVEAGQGAAAPDVWDAH